MPLYQILHMAEPPRGVGGVFAPRGAVRKLWKTRDFETIISGPAETGKTWGCCQYLDALAWQFPRAQLVMARKTYNDLVGSVVGTFRRVIGENSPVKPFGGQVPQWYDYPNGSRIWLAGLDRPGKALSSERDAIYVNQAEELKLVDWEVLTTRCTGRGAVMPYTRLFGDCNPDAPSHWIRTRPQIRLFESRHEDNPALFDMIAKGKGYAFKITPQGRRSLAILNALTGARKQRLRFGRWVQAEGVVYETWDAARNLIDRMPDGWENWRYIRSIDFGYTNPFVCQWWAVDPDGRMYLFREIYYSRRIVEDHVMGVRDEDDYNKIIVPGIQQYSADEDYEATVADHDAEDRATLDRYGVSTTAAYKNIKNGVNAVSERMRLAGDGRPRLFVVRGCTVEIDPWLAERKLPTKTETEVDSYVWEKPPKTGSAKDRNPKEKPLDKDNHGMDAMRYAVAYEDLQGRGTIINDDEVAVF